MEKTRDFHLQNVNQLEAILLTGADSLDATDIPTQLDDAREKCTSISQVICRKKAVLGINELESLAELSRSPFLQLRLNARALKKRIRDRLRHRKFELERLERSYRYNMNGRFIFCFSYQVY